eukprot:gene19241-23003_t
MSMRALTPLSYFEPFGAALSRVDAALAPGSEQGVNEESEDNYFLFGGVDENAPDHDEEVYFRGSREASRSARIAGVVPSLLEVSSEALVVRGPWRHPRLQVTYNAARARHSLWRVDSEVTEDPVAGGSELTHDLDFLAAELPLQPPFGAPEAAAPAPAPSNLTLALHCIWEEAEDSPPAAE